MVLPFWRIHQSGHKRELLIIHRPAGLHSQDSAFPDISWQFPFPGSLRNFSVQLEMQVGKSGVPRTEGGENRDGT